jgi:carbon-monoxide dehydrogenase medium subunit
VIPADFEYRVPETLEDAIGLLSEGGEDAKLLAGGHSLLPLMKLRLAAPTLLVDLRKVPGLQGVQREDGSFRIGAMTTHATLETTAELGLLAEVAGTIADQMVRNRGTIGGSLAHGDPASDLPAVVIACGGSVTVQGPSGQREIHARDLFQDYLTTAIEADEVMTEVRIETMEGYGYGYEKFNRRAEDWAMVAVAALVKATGGVCEDVRVGLTHMGSVPMRSDPVEQALRGQPLDAERIRQAAEQAAEGTDPPGDLNATPDYKRHLARVLCRRALARAAGIDVGAASPASRP